MSDGQHFVKFPPVVHIEHIFFGNVRPDQATLVKQTRSKDVELARQIVNIVGLIFKIRGFELIEHIINLKFHIVR